MKAGSSASQPSPFTTSSSSSTDSSSLMDTGSSNDCWSMLHLPLSCLFTSVIFIYFCHVCLPLWCLFTSAICICMYCVYLHVLCLFTCTTFIYLYSDCLPVPCLWTDLGETTVLTACSMSSNMPTVSVGVSTETFFKTSLQAFSAYS